MGNQIDEEALEGDNPQSEVPTDKEERYKQIIQGKEKQASEAEKARLLEKAARQVLANPEKLADLPPETGRVVVKMLYEEWNATTDDYDELVSGLKHKRQEIDEEEILRKFEERQEQKKAKSLVSEWISKYPAEKHDELMEEFEDIAWDRVLDTAKTKKIIERIDAYYRKQELEEERKDMAFASFASSNVKQRTTTSSWPKKSTVKAAKWLGMNEREMKELGLI